VEKSKIGGSSMKGYTFFDRTTSTGQKLKDKEKLFVMLVMIFGPIPAKNRTDRMAIAEELECSERTVYRVLSGVKASVEIDFDNRARLYRLSNSRPSLLEQAEDRLPVNQITDESHAVKDADRLRHAETMPVNRNRLRTEDEHVCPSAFGKKPKDFLIPCLLCPIDEECLAATQAAERNADR
jgi:hypothetical protein